MVDRWGNKTDMKEFTVTPMFEEVLDKKLWWEFKLPSDYIRYANQNSNYKIEGMFDDIICPRNQWRNLFYPEVLSLPSLFTIDLGVEAKLSRFNMVPSWQFIYTAYPREFEVYGTASDNPGDNLSPGGDWTLIGKFKSWKPSGDDLLMVTTDDQNYAWPGGENFDIKPSPEQPNPYFTVRMIRFRIMVAYKKSDSSIAYGIDELTLWGEIIK
jgi:hypothetical protein